jgi:hypothetical protein
MRRWLAASSALKRGSNDGVGSFDTHLDLLSFPDAVCGCCTSPQLPVPDSAGRSWSLGRRVPPSRVPHQRLLFFGISILNGVVLC